MISLLSCANSDESLAFFKTRGISVQCEQSDQDVLITHITDILPVLEEEAAKAWRDQKCLHFDQAFIPHSDIQIHPVKVINGYHQARNYRIRNSLGPAF